MAVRPPEDVLDRLAALARPAHPALRWTHRHQWHVTLRFLGQVEEPAVVVAALSRARLPPAEAALGPAVGRFGRRVVQVPVSGLDGLAAAVHQATLGLGTPQEARPFTGHVTLARIGRRGCPGLAVVTGERVSAAWPVREVSLVESHLGRDGARYDVLARYALGEPAQP